MRPLSDPRSHNRGATTRAKKRMRLQRNWGLRPARNSEFCTKKSTCVARYKTHTSPLVIGAWSLVILPIRPILLHPADCPHNHEHEIHHCDTIERRRDVDGHRQRRRANWQSASGHRQRRRAPRPRCPAAAHPRHQLLGHGRDAVPRRVQRQPVQAADPAAGDADRGRSWPPAPAATSRPTAQIIFAAAFLIFSGVAGYVSDRYQQADGRRDGQGRRDRDHAARLPGFLWYDRSSASPACSSCCS